MKTKAMKTIQLWLVALSRADSGFTVMSGERTFSVEVKR
jgi:hypothetical protein